MAIDWTRSMAQTFEYYEVDPITWTDIRKLTNVTQSSIERDMSAETLGSASFDVTEELPEIYIRVYLVAVQDRVRYRFPLGTYLAQTPSVSFDGYNRNCTLDAYTPLLEVKENAPPLGYYTPKNAGIESRVLALLSQHTRTPVLPYIGEDTSLYDNFVADSNENWLSYTKALAAKADKEITLDELGRIFLSPYRDTAAMNPVWTYTDDNSSILLPSISVERDIYGMPNVIELVYSQNGQYKVIVVKNEDPESPSSIVRRGREIVKREVNPEGLNAPNDTYLKEYAKKMLERESTLTYKVTYEHGYCPVRIGDCVMIDYKRSGFENLKAKVIQQSITCSTGCKVSETAIFTTKLWGGKAWDYQIT